MDYQSTQQHTKLHSNLYTTDISSQSGYDDSSQITYHSTLSEETRPYHYHGHSLKESQDDELSQMRNSLNPTQQVFDIKNIPKKRDDQTYAKGWDSFATRLWGRLPKGPKVGSTTLAYGITNLLGIDTIEEAEEPFIPCHTQTMSALQSEPVKLSEKELIPNFSLNFDKKPFSTNDDNISSHSVKSLDNIDTDEVTELRQMLKVNQKAFSKAIKDQTKLIHKLQKEQENLLETLRITNNEREEQENLLSNLNISLNQSSQQVEILKSKLLHYKHVFRRRDFPPISSPSQLCIPDVAPFEVEQVVGESRVRVQIELAITISGDLYLMIDGYKKKRFLNTSHIIEMNLNLENGLSCVEFFLVTVTKGSFLFIVDTEHALKECLKLFQSNIYLKNIIKQKLRTCRTIDKPAFLTSQLEDFFGLSTCFSSEKVDPGSNITKENPRTKQFVSKISNLSSHIPKDVQDQNNVSQHDAGFNALQSPRFPSNAHFLNKHNSFFKQYQSYRNNEPEDFFKKEPHKESKTDVNKEAQLVSQIFKSPGKEQQFNVMGPLVSSCETILNKNVDMNKSSLNHLHQDMNQRRVSKLLWLNEMTSCDSKDDGTITARSKTQENLDLILRFENSCLEEKAASPTPKDEWEKKIPLKILEEELNHRVTLQSSKSSDLLTDSTDKTYNYAAFLLTENEND
ncbi:uncharacterized protein LOC128882852 isoform X2 [Hylaeus volcanicus]|uniref:uncharacterized protein LOC128882852 isoform X2 n=1 Tax=Hylaeus volcanicus TaxID=313075 RepID=UPI0023B869F9|nr:uncharacterized protein LOC128882852 isoform X2 [Hylaeus volcanicus]